jgi:hypothetical protein
MFGIMTDKRYPATSSHHFTSEAKLHHDGIDGYEGGGGGGRGVGYANPEEKVSHDTDHGHKSYFIRHLVLFSPKRTNFVFAALF